MDAVLNWLWQGTLVALAVRAWLRYAGSLPARVRYRALWAALAIVLLLPAVPLLLASSAPLDIDGFGATAGEAPVAIPAGWWMSAAVPLALWAGWVLVHAFRLIQARRALGRLRARTIDVPPAWEARLASWNRIAGSGRRAELVLSRDIPAAAVLGGRAPAIALAPHLFGTLTDAEIDRIVVHEWAHVQRRDDLAHACQVIVHAVAGWHPGVVLLERALHLEREVACDDVVIGVTGSAKAYAACLARLATLPQSNLAVVAVASPSMLGRRIARLLSPSRLASSSSWTISALGGVALCMLSTAVGTLRLVGPMLPSAPSVQALRTSAEPRIVDLRPSMTQEPTNAGTSAGRATPLTAPTPAPADSAPVPTGPVTVARDIAEAPVDTTSAVEVATTHPVATPSAAQLPVAPEAAAIVPAPAPVVTIEPAVTPEPAVATPSHSVLQIQSLPAASPASASTAAADAPARGDSPWTVAADTGIAIGKGYQDAGVAVGKGSQRAAESTAGFFTRVGKRIAGAF